MKKKNAFVEDVNSTEIKNLVSFLKKCPMESMRTIYDQCGKANLKFLTTMLKVQKSDMNFELLESPSPELKTLITREQKMDNISARDKFESAVIDLINDKSYLLEISGLVTKLPYTKSTLRVTFYKNNFFMFYNEDFVTRLRLFS